MDAKSVITSPSGGETLRGAGVCENLRAGVVRARRCPLVDVTTDGGLTWSPAELQSPVLPRAHTRFRWSWRWDSREALLASRCEDDSGYVQPRRQDLVKERGANYGYHQNGIQVWKVAASGAVTNGNV
jgi:sulfane dehydrogenase subunit SoxC